MFGVIKNFFSKNISHDEKIVFEKISLMLPEGVRLKFDRQVDSIIESKPSSDNQMMIYKIDTHKLREKSGEGFFLTQDKGLVEFAKIDVRLFDQTQPFLLCVNDGLIHSLRLYTPIAEILDLQEFSVVRFELLNHAPVVQ
jgi:hypothetical protein